MLYDGLLVLGIAIALTFVGVGANDLETVPKPLQFALILASAVGFCTYFWVAHGRTLGMQAWHLRLESTGGGRVSVTQALTRFTLLLPGVLLIQAGEYWRPAVIFALLYFQAAYLWALFNPERATWADLLSQTRMICLQPERR